MTNPTSHRQVPDTLIDLIDAYAETRHRYGRIHNARTKASRNAVIEALSGVQALSAAPANHNASRALQGLDFIMRVYEPCMGKPAPDEEMAIIVEATKRLLLGWWGEHRDTVRAMLAASPTPPAEQQATKETSGGFHVWRDISTAPKDGSRFVATGHNYGLYSEVRHTCVAQWFRGCWMEASDWNETSELKYLTHWMPLPSPPDDVAAPAEQQAAPKAAPAQQEWRLVLPGGKYTDKWESARIGDYNRGWNDYRKTAIAALNSVVWPARTSGSWVGASTWLRNNYQDYPNIASLCDAMLEAAPQPAPAAQEDAARLDWLEQNLFHREKDEWDTKFGGYKEYNMWVLFSPKGIQGSARNIIDAAREQGADHDR